VNVKKRQQQCISPELFEGSQVNVPNRNITVIPTVPYSRFETNHREQLMSPPSKEIGKMWKMTFASRDAFPNVSAEVDNRCQHAFDEIIDIGDTVVRARDERTIKERSALFQAFYTSLVTSDQPVVEIPMPKLSDQIKENVFSKQSNQSIHIRPKTEVHRGRKFKTLKRDRKKMRVKESEKASDETASFFESVFDLVGDNPDIWSFFAIPVELRGPYDTSFSGGKVLTSRRKAYIGDTLLHYILRKGNGAVRRLLVNRLSNRQVELLHMRNDYGETPLDVIKAANDPVISTLLSLPPRDARKSR